MKKLFIIMMTGILLPLSLLAQQHREDHDWTVNSTYESTMSFTIEVQQGGTTNPSFEIGAFCGTECRGTAMSTYVSQLNRYLWYLVIHGEGGEAINFFVRENGVEQDVVTSFNSVFAPNGVVGYPATPQVVNFVLPVAIDYIMISDASQLVPGRKYFIANGNDGNVMAMGRQGNGKRFSIPVEVTDHKANFIPAFNPLDDRVFVFTLGANGTDWTLFDEVSGGFLETEGDRFDLDVDAQVSAHSKWQINLNADGTATLLNAITQYYMAYFDGQGFYCSDDSCQLYVFAECELVSGELTALNVNKPESMYVVPSGSTLTVGELSTVNVSNLILEDNAQLVNASPNVLATLQKNIVAYAGVADGWYTLAAPLCVAPVASSTNMTAFEYDLYEYAEPLYREEWRNYKLQENFKDVTPGIGYLYANNHDVVLNLFGTLNVADVTCNLTYTNSRPDELKGFNLIGNPYPHTIYKGQGGAINDSRLADGYYVLSNDGAWQVKTYTEPILPGTGIMVVTSETGDFTIVNTATIATAESNSRRGVAIESRLALNVSNGNAEDVAYLSETEGIDLPKLAHRNTLLPELSFCYKNKSLAIAHVDERCEVMDIRLECRTAGTYTLTWDVSEWQGGCLFLIDNETCAETDMLHSSSYTFDATGNDYPFRFKLMLKGDDNGSFNSDFAYISNGEITINGTGKVQVCDVLGRQVLSGQADSLLLIPRGSLPAGVYVLSLIDGENNRTQKIVVR